jgi:hypothetical protein
MGVQSSYAYVTIITIRAERRCSLLYTKPNMARNVTGGVILGNCICVTLFHSVIGIMASPVDFKLHRYQLLKEIDRRWPVK